MDSRKKPTIVQPNPEEVWNEMAKIIHWHPRHSRADNCLNIKKLLLDMTAGVSQPSNTSFCQLTRYK